MPIEMPPIEWSTTTTGVSAARPSAGPAGPNAPTVNPTIARPTSSTAIPINRFPLRNTLSLSLAHHSRQLDFSFRAPNLRDGDLDRVAEPEDTTPAATLHGGAERVQLEVVAREPASRHVALEHLPE